MMRTLRTGRTWAFVAGVGLVVAAGLVATPASADTAPADPAVTKTVSADGLPTAQINGVVWDQEVVGNTVFVAGDFTAARPAGSDPGVNEVARTYLMSYDVTTGVMTSWAPVLNAQVKELAVSPDKTRLYAAGQFTSVNGQTRYRLAAFDTATGALISTFKPTINATVSTVTASATAVAFGGTFTNVNGAARTNIAAVDLAGATLPFAPTPAGGSIQASVFAPDGQSVVFGGAFTTMNGSSNPGYGLARLDLATSALTALPVNTQIRNGGADSAILSLEADGDNFYGTGYHYGGGGNVEGTFAASWSTGALSWVEDCHGDTYSSYPVGDVIYSASHKHYCGNSGGFPQTDPWSFYRATALTKTPMGTNTADIYGYPDHAGQPRPDILYWYPDINTGSFTGKNQGPWSVAGNGKYVVYGGEFTRVNNVKQQGLVRFATSDVAPNSLTPVLKSTTWPLTAKSYTAGQVRLSWGSNWDRDNQTLTYKLYRQSTNNAPVYTTTLTTPFWKPKSMSYTDTGLTPGSTTRYRIAAVDSFGNQALSDWVTITVNSTDTLSAYAGKVLDDGALDYWRLGEASGPTVADWAGSSDATAGAGVTFNQTGAIGGDSNTAASFNGSSTGFAATSNLIEGPQTFGIEAWFKTTTTSGGKIVGFGNANTGTSTNYDRHVYMSPNGRVNFGVYPGSSQIVTSSKAYNDGQWHQVVASLGSDGMKLFIDGKRVAQRADITSAQSYSGYWRIGGDSPWDGNAFFNGSIDDVAIYGGPLTAAQVDSHWVAAGNPSTIPTAPADSYGAAVFNLSPDLYWRLGESSGTVAADSGPLGVAGTYYNGVTKGTTGALAGVASTAATFNGSNGQVVSTSSFNNPTTYSEELWFKTTTTNGGKLIGFGDSTSGLSGSYDRHVYMETGGQLTFGVWTGQTNTITTAASFNDGAWHHMVATQSSDGMKLYVDGTLRGTNSQASAQAYSGYWHVGGDVTWGPQPWFAGAIDEVAVYSSVLTPTQVQQHYQLGTGTVPNQAPVAAFTTSATGLKVDVDGSGSSDADGTIASYAWTFEGGGTATGATASYTFPATGTYTIGLTVTDDDGATKHLDKTVSVTAPNQSPVAAFTTTITNLKVDVDASGSSDADGTIASYAWTFEGGGTDTGKTASYTFPAAGTYTIGLTVTDDDGATKHLDKTVTVSAANQAPVAAFTTSATDLKVDVDASDSSDPDGTIASYAWTFEGGGTGTGKTASYTFPATGTYTIGLTVTDDDGATKHLDKTVSVTAPPADQPPANALAWDTFGRTVASGWGNAQVGGAWTSTGTASRFSVGSGLGQHTVPAGGTLTSSLGTVSSTSTDVSVSLSPDKLLTGGGAWITLQGRTVGSDVYAARVRLQADGTVQLHLMRSATALRGGTVTGVTYGAGDQLKLRLQVTGTSPTTISAKVWKGDATEPSAWTYTITDSTAALQSAGGLGIQTYLFGTVTNGPVTLRYDDLKAIPAG